MMGGWTAAWRDEDATCVEEGGNPTGGGGGVLGKGKRQHWPTGYNRSGLGPYLVTLAVVVAGLSEVARSLAGRVGTGTRMLRAPRWTRKLAVHSIPVSPPTPPQPVSQTVATTDESVTTRQDQSPSKIESRWNEQTLGEG